jgi:hypothetical protein
LRRHRVLDALIFLLTDELAGEWRRAALDANGGTTGLSGVLMHLATAAATRST